MAELADSLRELDLPLLGRVLLAAVIGGVIGFERELAAKPAGLRTNMLICVGAALVMAVSTRLALLFHGPPSADPTRMAAHVLSGIGFIGAGSILVARGTVIQGLTTAATIWVVAALGLAVGAGLYVLAVGTAVLALVILKGLSWLETFIQKDMPVRIEVSLEEGAAAGEVLEGLRGAGAEVRLVASRRHREGSSLTLEVVGSATDRERALLTLSGRKEVLRTELSGREKTGLSEQRT